MKAAPSTSKAFPFSHIQFHAPLGPHVAVRVLAEITGDLGLILSHGNAGEGFFESASHVSDRTAQIQRLNKPIEPDARRTRGSSARRWADKGVSDIGGD